MRYIVILAGGSGTRLWPLSRRRAPKQVRALLDEETLLEKTYRRVRERFPSERIFVATCTAYVSEVRQQLPELPTTNVLVEPMARDTAAAIGYAALRLQAHDADAVFTTVNADAYVADTRAYLDAIDRAQHVVETSRAPAVLVGLAPTYPETGYGYIEMGALADGTASPAHDSLIPHPVVRFVEKPDAETAAQYVASGTYLWNLALFSFRSQRLLELLRLHLPDHARALEHIATIDDAHAVMRAFQAMPAVSIDYGLMEKLDDLLVIPAAFGWADVGHWRAVHQILAADSEANVSRGTHVAVDSSGNLVVAQTGKVVATYGLRNHVIIDTPDALLVCPRERAQGVREIVRELERLQLTEYL